MRKEIILYFDEPRTIDVGFFNYDYDDKHPSQTVRVETKIVKIKYYYSDIREVCYITNATSMELIDCNDGSICHTEGLHEEDRVRVVNKDSQTVIEIY